MKHLIQSLLPLLLVVALLPACTDSTFRDTRLQGTYIDRSPVGTVDQAYAFYNAGDFRSAYATASPIANDYLNDRYLEAAYVGGLSAMELGDLPQADRLLRQAAGSRDGALSVDATASLGMVYSQQGRYRQAASTLLGAAPKLTGENRAQAYYYAGIAQQKSGQWSQARATLYNAIRFTRDAALQAQIRQQLAATGWTLQAGAFSNAAFAQEQAQAIAQRSVDLGLGSPRLIQSTAANGQSLTLIQVGTFTSYQSAATYRDTLGVTGVIVKAIGE